MQVSPQNHVLRRKHNTLPFSHNLEDVIFDKIITLPFREFFHSMFNVKSFPSRFIRKSPERAFQRYISLSKLTSELKFMLKWSKSPYILIYPLFPIFPFKLYIIKVLYFFNKILPPLPFPKYIVTWLKSHYKYKCDYAKSLPLHSP